MLGCSAENGTEHLGTAELEVSAPKKAFCKVSVSGHGTMDLEKEYLPRVITCENGGAKLEAMKAQAIAARSVAYYSMATSGSICDSQSCQVMSCGQGPSELARRAVRETSGMYLSHKGTLTYGFYVAGDSGASKPTCKDSSGSTSHYVTYNAGKTGHAVDSTSLGGVGSQNRGCMSQWGARCLDEEKNFTFMNILHFYYGADINVVQAQGACVDEVDTLKAKLVRKWSNLKRYRGKKADYVACAGDDFKLGFTFKNTGSAVWKDVPGRGNELGEDVYLVTANGKTDKLTGKKRFSVKLNQNDLVRGDHGSKECTQKGCRKTTFVEGGIMAHAPEKPGIYPSRWRLRDYSKPTGKSQGFGPKVELKVRVLDCQAPAKECGCRVWCNDGKSHQLKADALDESGMCKTAGEVYCSPGKYVSHEFEACDASDPDIDSVDPGVDPGVGDDPDAPGNDWVASEFDDDSVVEPEDDPDFEEDGFAGDDAPILPTKSDEGGCSIGPGEPSAHAGLALALFGILLAFRRKETRR
jgi:MYXO-CTERM domain-containing protein